MLASATSRAMRQRLWGSQNRPTTSRTAEPISITVALPEAVSRSIAATAIAAKIGLSDARTAP
jgi:hypothetical protein